MLNSIKKLSGCRILATDGEVGAVAEAVYFGDEQWVVRYLVVDTRGWLRGRSVLISPYAVTSIDWEARYAPTDRAKFRVRSNVSLLSRDYEHPLRHRHSRPHHWE